MALRVPPPAGLKSGNQFIKSSNSWEIRTSPPPLIGGRGGAVIKCSLKQKRKGYGTLFPSSSPMQLTEDIASAFGLEMVVLDLERLFKQAGGGDPLRPQPSGPCSPSTTPGFSRRPVRVAYQGVRGSYCQEAAIKAFSPVCNAFPCDHMEDAFDALENAAADRAIIPTENSIDGTIDRNFDLLLRHEDVDIVGELILPVNHCLLALPGTSISDLKRIVSHPQALSHCKTRLESLDLEVDEVPNAADAAKFVSESRISDTAVIGSRIAAKESGYKLWRRISRMGTLISTGFCNWGCNRPCTDQAMDLLHLRLGKPPSRFPWKREFRICFGPSGFSKAEIYRDEGGAPAEQVKSGEGGGEGDRQLPVFRLRLHLGLGGKRIRYPCEKLL